MSFKKFSADLDKVYMVINKLYSEYRFCAPETTLDMDRYNHICDRMANVLELIKSAKNITEVAAIMLGDLEKLIAESEGTITKEQLENER